MNELISSKVGKYLLYGFYVITMSIAFATRHGYLELGTTPQLIIGLLWIIVGIIKLICHRFSKRDFVTSNTIFFLKLFLLPQVVLHLHFLVLIALGITKWDQFSMNLTTYIPCIFGVLSVYILKEKTVLLTAVSVILAWVVSVLAACFAKGFYVIIDAVKEAYISDYYLLLDHPNYLELHDLVLSLGYFVVFFFLVKKAKLTRKNLLVIFLITSIMFLGLKRIVILALFAISAFTVLVRQRNQKKKSRIYIKFGYCIIVFSYLFVFLISLIGNYQINDLISKIGINTRGRLYYYNAVMQLGDFSPSFMGIGRNVIVQHLSEELSYLRIKAPHSDILKVYIENGFLLFGWWLWYTLVRSTKKISKRFSFEKANIYLILCVYTYILNLTDNVDTYFICRILPIQMIMVTSIFGCNYYMPLGKIKEEYNIHSTLR